jgi:hypothetical protein
MLLVVPVIYNSTMAAPKPFFVIVDFKYISKLNLYMLILQSALKMA